MTDEAHAASSPPAEAATPSERDYDAIHAVFMETARGRWFLAEFAKRNRNADTSMVLDAVARIERSLLPAKDAPADPGEIVAAVGNLVAQAKHQAGTALQGQPTADKLSIAYRSIRAIREIAWTLREYGSEAGVCDGLDAHANAIDRSLDQLATAAPGEVVAAIFDDLIQRLEAVGGGAMSATQATAPDVLPESAPPPLAHAETDTIHREAPLTPAFSSDLESGWRQDSPSHRTPADEPAVVAPATPAPALSIDAAAAVDPPPEAMAGAAAPPAFDAIATAEAEEAHDLAVLDIIAMEMAAPASEADDETSLSAIDADTDADADAVEGSEGPGEAFDLCKESPASLGAALIASGAIRPRSLSGAGRFAAIQRLSQAEKVALFS